ncbi:hypothetical protein CTAYLR_003332 [Chrysophaeum taylorii]|uniref:Clp1 P-loop domain-containing protein n=1 Tax=Chrysophaeum taylorii TaxID=2483200 RepID=A0AAD7XM29_9STRA|nr:hypothetical protein CTAYLR_003332 [Chrysophaeum taylorii]
MRGTVDVASFSWMPLVTVKGNIVVEVSKGLSCARGGGTVIPRAWREAGAAFRRDGGRVVVCGPKGSGKSCLARYLVNRGLGSAVALLDCDPGQPLCGAPGFVSLRILRRPMLAAPHREAHDEYVVAQQYIGDVSPRDAPEAYAACVARLIEAADRLPSLNLVVNTCGWVTGLGLNLLETIVTALSPTVFALGDGLPGTRLPAFSGPPTAAAQQKRALQLAAYFVPDLAGAEARNGALADPDSRVAETVAAATPWAARIDSLAVALVGPAYAATSDLAEFPDLLFSVLNASLVGIAETTDLPENAPRSGLLVLADVTDIPCRGLAIVRGIDFHSGHLLLLTPDPLALHGADLLLRGKLSLPTNLLNRGGASTAFPFLSCESITADLATTMRSRHNIKRGGAPVAP